MDMVLSVPDFSLELAAGAGAGKIIAGVDEAGRGSWAGCVVAAAVVLDYKNIPAGLNDSKKLTAVKRELLYTAIMADASVGIGSATNQEIDKLNILQATKIAMQRAVAGLAVVSDFILVDGNQLPVFSCPAIPAQLRC
jgi:ribonuclease HII